MEPTAYSYSEMRDIEKNPYSTDEKRVAEYLVKRGGFGGGDDPIGFILASHATLTHQRQCMREAVTNALADARLAGLPEPTHLKLLLEMFD